MIVRRSWVSTADTARTIEETCPACNSTEVVAELLTLVTARFSIRRLMCWTCRWTWFVRGDASLGDK